MSKTETTRITKRKRKTISKTKIKTKPKSILNVYAHPASQPSRAVIWACLIHNMSFTLHADVASISDRNPRGQLPALADRVEGKGKSKSEGGSEGEGLLLLEMPAILTYLAEKYGWVDVYPPDLTNRAIISQYLHAHHSLSRLATLKLMAPHVLVVFGGLPVQNPLSYVNNTLIGQTMREPAVLADGQAAVSPVIEFIETHYLSQGDFIGGLPAASIADLACYEELSQLQTAGLMEFSGFPRLEAWLQRMSELPFHDEVHHFNQVLGNIVEFPNTMERFAAAIESALGVLQALPGIVLVGDG